MEQLDYILAIVWLSALVVVIVMALICFVVLLIAWTIRTLKDWRQTNGERK